MGCGGGSALPPGASSGGISQTVTIYEQTIERIDPGSDVYDITTEFTDAVEYNTIEQVHLAGFP